ncbi:hypothetical protein Scep_016218 [Stephania cephalantha]|uniref:Uncharacterized protein n=1 Tax=Stephania cephalantha TaxID=152367 RepID=A0AAP0IN28_9MAGN
MEEIKSALSKEAINDCDDEPILLIRSSGLSTVLVLNYVNVGTNFCNVVPRRGQVLKAILRVLFGCD